MNDKEALTMGSVRVAIVGAATLKGRELKEVLDDKNFPVADVKLLDSLLPRLQFGFRFRAAAEFIDHAPVLWAEALFQRLRIAPATPPPSISSLFAALTIAATCCSTRSPAMITICGADIPQPPPLALLGLR